eukprot:TRINITY_DN8188_c0_g1_i2.p1 TRINITY_DN8188_c0_g1~~TRINITY_DN8188_c0_g1_i2.p1  ORF type:complete len:109 (-),score=22.63 TRINITY_DN8188_c0_g1_i2:50-376(-)
MIIADIQPLQNFRIVKRLTEFIGKEEYIRGIIDEGFHRVEKAISKTAGEYCYGDQITLVDICLVPQVYNAVRYEVDMSQFPTISRINETLLTHPAFIAAHPSNQPDAA